MKLAELDPQLYRHSFDTEGREVYEPVSSVAEAQGVMMLCPLCFEKNHGEIGTHRVMCWFRDRGVPASASPGPARWASSGTSLADLTLTPSILLTSGCGWHGYVTQGLVTTC